MNWIELIGLLLGGTSIVSVIGAIIYFKPRMKTENLSAKDKDIEVSKNAMALVVTLEERLNAKAEMITRLESIANENNTRIREQGWLIQQHERRLEGMQRAINSEVIKKKFAERLICFNEKCQIREPELGSFKSRTCDTCVDGNINAVDQQDPESEHPKTRKTKNQNNSKKSRDESKIN